MLKKIFTKTLTADFWTCVIMSITGCPLPYPSDLVIENEKVNKSNTCTDESGDSDEIPSELPFGVNMVQEKKERISTEV
jgi:hypothetical protein